MPIVPPSLEFVLLLCLISFCSSTARHHGVFNHEGHNIPKNNFGFSDLKDDDGNANLVINNESGVPKKENRSMPKEVVEVANRDKLISSTTMNKPNNNKGLFVDEEDTNNSTTEPYSKAHGGLKDNLSNNHHREAKISSAAAAQSTGNHKLPVISSSSVVVSWPIPSKKIMGEKQPGFNLDYSSPKTHPPTHN